MTEPTQPDGYYPRLNASMLQTRKFIGKIVCMVGAVESFDGQHITLRCADGLTVPINAAESEFTLPAGTIVELVGFVQEDNVVQLFVTREFTNDFDLEVYNKMITEVQHNPKFAQYFVPPNMVKQE